MALTGLLSAGFVQSLRRPPPRCKCAHISRGPLSLSHSNNNNSVGVNLPIWPSSSIVRPDRAYLGNCCLAALVTSASFAKHRRYFHGTNRCDWQTLDINFPRQTGFLPKKRSWKAHPPDGRPFFIFQQVAVCLRHESVSLFASLTAYVLHRGIYQSAQDKSFL